jgi:hypothetical protein
MDATEGVSDSAHASIQFFSSEDWRKGYGTKGRSYNIVPARKLRHLGLGNSNFGKYTSKSIL